MIIFSSLLFGLAHYTNGGWVFTINSTFAGFFFALCYLEMGLIGAWGLHFLWNFIVVTEMLVPAFFSKLQEAHKQEEETLKTEKKKKKPKKENIVWI